MFHLHFIKSHDTFKEMKKEKLLSSLIKKSNIGAQNGFPENCFVVM